MMLAFQVWVGLGVCLYLYLFGYLSLSCLFGSCLLVVCVYAVRGVIRSACLFGPPLLGTFVLWHMFFRWLEFLNSVR